MSETQVKLTALLAMERTRMAAERTLMSWVRKALSMITFGFTIFSRRRSWR
jgi:putative membrane protein